MKIGPRPALDLHQTTVVTQIEANPDYHRALLEKNRRSYVLRACLGVDGRPATVRMRRDGVLSGIVGVSARSSAAANATTK